MKRCLPATGMLWLVLLASCAQRAPAPPPDPARPLPEATLRADFARARAALLEGHAALDRYQSRAEAIARLDRIERSLDRPMSPLAFWRTVQAGLVELRDGHLSLQPSSPMVAALYQHPGRCLPFRVFLEQGRLFVGTVRLPTPGIREGREILEIAGLPAAVLLDSLSRFISRDGEVESRRQVVLERDFSLLLAMALDFPAEIALRFSHEDSASDSVRVALVPYRKLAKAPPPPAQGLERVLGGRAAILTVTSFSADGKVGVGKFFRDSFRAIRREGIQDLVIDVRQNGGGRDALGAQLFAYVATDSFRYVRRRWLRAAHFEFVKGTPDHWINLMAWFLPKRPEPYGVRLNAKLDGSQRPVEDAYRGRVYVLCDGSTFSTASEFVCLFRHEKRGLVLGDESGNAIQGDSGADVSVLLEHTGLSLNVPLVRYDLPYSPAAPAARGVLPDEWIRPSLEDRLHGRDPVRERAIQLIAAAEAAEAR